MVRTRGGKQSRQPDLVISRKPPLRKSTREAVKAKSMPSTNIFHQLLLGPTLARQERKRKRREREAQAKHQATVRSPKFGTKMNFATLKVVEIKQQEQRAAKMKNDPRKQPPCKSPHSHTPPKPEVSTSTKITGIKQQNETMSSRKKKDIPKTKEALTSSPPAIAEPRVAPTVAASARVVLRKKQAKTTPTLAFENKELPKIRSPKAKDQKDKKLPPKPPMRSAPPTPPPVESIENHEDDEVEWLETRSPQASANQVEWLETRPLPTLPSPESLGTPALIQSLDSIISEITARRTLTLFKRRSFALESLMTATDLSSIYAALTLVKEMYQGVESLMHPSDVKLVMEAQVAGQVLLSQSLRDSLTRPRCFGGCAYPDAKAAILAAHLTQTLGPNLLGAIVISAETLVGIGLAVSDAIDVLPFFMSLADDIQRKYYCLSETMQLIRNDRMGEVGFV